VFFTSHLTGTHTFPSGNPDPHDFGTADAVVDYESGPGGETDVEANVGCPLGTCFRFNTSAYGVDSRSPSNGTSEFVPKHWIISSPDVPNESFTAFLTLRYDPDDLPEGATESDLEMARVDEVTGNVDLIPVSVNLTEHSVTTTMAVTSWGLFGILYTSQPVSVFLQQFDLQLSDNGVLVSWQLADASGVDGFNIYRSLEADTHFERLNNDLVQRGEYLDESAAPGTSYWYRLGVVDEGQEWLSPATDVTLGKPATSLAQNYPNPFNPSTKITFYLAQDGPVSLTVYDVGGREVATLVSTFKSAGRHEAVWYGKDNAGHFLGSGVYFYKLKTKDTVITKKLTVLK